MATQQNLPGVLLPDGMEAVKHLQTKMHEHLSTFIRHIPSEKRYEHKGRLEEERRIAEEAGISPHTLKKFIHEETNPTASTLFAIAKTLNYKFTLEVNDDQ